MIWLFSFTKNDFYKYMQNLKGLQLMWPYCKTELALLWKQIPFVILLIENSKRLFLKFAWTNGEKPNKTMKNQNYLFLFYLKCFSRIINFQTLLRANKNKQFRNSVIFENIFFLLRFQKLMINGSVKLTFVKNMYIKYFIYEIKKINLNSTYEIFLKFSL